MRFGGHETFAVRETWLSKGLKLIAANAHAFEDPLVADSLGVGANMAKSIRHWLRLTRLASPEAKGKFAPTALGRLVLKHDPAMLRPATWWALHVNVASQSEEAIAWHWTFSRFSSDHRFDRQQCIEALNRHLESEGQRMPSPRSVSSDFAVLLTSYAREVPPSAEDPDEALDPPFRQLGLMVHYRASDTFRIDRSPKPVPPEILCYSMATTFMDERGAGGWFDVHMREAVGRPGGQGRVLALSPDAFATCLAEAERALGPASIRSEMLGGDRIIRVAAMQPADWLAAHYRRVG